MSTESTTRAYIALGSNLKDPLKQVNRGVEALENISHTRVLKQSPWYRSRAVGPGDQPDYINGIALIETRLSPDELFQHTQRIELDQGRERRVRWAARTLDLDIALYGDQHIHTDNLTIPHPRLRERNFVLYPLADISPNLILPDGTPLASLVAQCSQEGLEQLETSP